MREKHMTLCADCMKLIGETQKIAQYHGYREEKGKCEWCKKERPIYHCIVGGDGEALRDYSYPRSEIP